VFLAANPCRTDLAAPLQLTQGGRDRVCLTERNAAPLLGAREAAVHPSSPPPASESPQDL